MTLELWVVWGVLFALVAGISFIALRGAWEAPETAPRAPARANVDLIPANRSEMLFEGLTPALAGLLPSTTDGRAVIFQELRAAGYYQTGALTDYLALRNVLVFMSIVIAGGLALVLDAEYIPAIALGGLLAAVLSFSVPRLFIQARGRARYQQIQRGLPTAVDLLILALTAGLNLFAAMRRVADELRTSYPVLAEEFDITRRQAELSSLDLALDQLADRVRLPEMRNLATILAQTERLGGSATAVLLDTSDTLRANLRQRAESQANRTSFWMLFPTVGCFLVAAGLIIVGPVFLEFRTQLEENRSELEKGTQNIRNIRPPGGAKGQKGGAPAAPGALP